jgi:hypothetical protein
LELVGVMRACVCGGGDSGWASLISFSTYTSYQAITRITLNVFPCEGTSGGRALGAIASTALHLLAFVSDIIILIFSSSSSFSFSLLLLLLHSHFLFFFFFFILIFSSSSSAFSFSLLLLLHGVLDKVARSVPCAKRCGDCVYV